MLKPFVLANAFTAVSLVVYVVCRVLSLLAPDFLFGIAQSWFHTVSVDSLKVAAPWDLATFIFGAATLSPLVWVMVYIGALLYNKWAK